MSTCTVRPVKIADLDAAAELLAAGHQRAHESCGASVPRPAKYLDPRHCHHLLERLASVVGAHGVVAEHYGAMKGFLIGEPQRYSPEEFPSLYAEPESGSIPLHGHAVENRQDAGPVYAAMYAALARQWVREGLFVHNISVSAADALTGEAWNNLGFGRKSVCAMRPTGQPVAIRGDGVETDFVVERVEDPDHEVPEMLHRKLMKYQTGTPMFWAYDGRADASAAKLRQGLFQEGRAICFVAYRASRPVGMMLFAAPVFLSPLVVPEDTLYLWEGYVEPEFRSGGVASLLLERSMAWLRFHGHRWCALHFVAGNQLGRRFWLGNAFAPVEYTLKRHVDERVGGGHSRA